MLLMVQKKSARWISPRISQRALFSVPSAGLASVDFPPEINSNFAARPILRLEVLRRRTSLRTTSNYLKIRIWKPICGPNSGQVVPKSAISHVFWRNEASSAGIEPV